jgi:hypothetical protein
VTAQFMPYQPPCMFGLCRPPPPVPVEVLYAGAAPGLVAGVTQVNVRVPREQGYFPGFSLTFALAGRLFAASGVLHLAPP